MFKIESVVKQYISALLIVLVLLNCTYPLKQYDVYERGGVVVLSDKVGEVIDAEERKQYGLLLGTVGFQSAVLYEIIQGGYVIEIITKDDNYVVVNRDPQGLDILRDHIDRNEEVKKSKDDFEQKWKIVDYDKVGLAITQKEVNDMKGRGWTIGCGVAGSIGTAVLGCTVLWIYGLIAALGHDRDHINPWILIGVGLPLGVVTVVLVGISIEESRAINRIKQAREPRPIE
jgi:hypothetical protein